MSDETGKWLPYNEDGRQHDCTSKNGKEKQITLRNGPKETGIPRYYNQLGEDDETVMVLEVKKPTHCLRCVEWLDLYT
jgi:hypothetical protein